MYAWVEEAVLGAPDSDVALPSFEELEGAKEAEMTYLFKDKVERFKADNREEGQRDLLVHGGAPLRCRGEPAGGGRPRWAAEYATALGNQ